MTKKKKRKKQRQKERKKANKKATSQGTSAGSFKSEEEKFINSLLSKRGKPSQDQCTYRKHSLCIYVKTVLANKRP